MRFSRIYFDARYIRYDHHDGISRFSAGLISALSKRVNVTALISDTRQLAQLPKDIDHRQISSPTNFLTEPFVALEVNKLNAEVVFSPMQTMGSWFRKYKLVLTLHDLIYYAHPAPPATFSLPIRFAWRLFHSSYIPQRVLLNRADAVATVSNTTRKLIVEKRLTKRPISVIYNAAVRPNSKGEAESQGPHDGYPRTLLYMGSFMDYKNVETLIRGMRDLPGYELLLLSKISTKRKKELESLSTQSGGKVRFLNGVTDNQYHELLSQSMALVSASQDEGFGIPLIEAMSMGVPVVVSEIEIFEEIGGEAALFFDAVDPKAFTDSVRQLEDPSVWAERSRLSLIQAEKFSWDKSADELLKMIASL